MLTIYTNPDPGGNSVRKHNAIEFEVVGELPATKYIQISWTDKKNRKIDVSEASQKEWYEPSILIFPSKL